MTVGGASVGRIGRGLAVLVGVTHDDTESDAIALADKLVGLRVFPDEEGKMNLSVADVGGSVLVVSQFTLYGDAQKGRRPSYVAAGRPEMAEPLVDRVVEAVGSHGVPTATGSFGAMMAVDLVNDGPVTLLLDVRDGRVV